MKVAIGLGSNLGDRATLIKAASFRIEKDVMKGGFRMSRLYETAPWGILEQPSFLNAVAAGETDWRPPAIVEYLKLVEQELGRKVRIKNGPREIDLDLLCWGPEIVSAPGVEVPHPGIPEREFVLLPFNEVWPDWIHPKLGLSTLELLNRFQKAHRFTSEKWPKLPHQVERAGNH